jgi:hypothetical protein
MSSTDTSSAQKSRARAMAFEDAEASLRLEGFEPSLDPRYRAIKAQLILGEISFEEAEAAIREQFGFRSDPEKGLAATA